MTEAPVASKIRAKLQAALQPSYLDLLDESARHFGHGGHNPAGESHFRLTIVAAAFIGKNRLERHRMINRLLAEELCERVHALAIDAKTPQEASPSE